MIKTLQAVDNDFLKDHIIGDNAVLPTVCAIAWMADAAESIYRGYKFHELENYKLFKGVVFDGTEAIDYQIDVNLVEQNLNDKVSDSSPYLKLDAKISSLNAKGKLVFHYGGELLLKPTSKKVSLETVDLATTNSSNGKSAEEAHQLYSNGTLFHGESLQGIQEVIHCDETGLLLKCQVPAVAMTKQGDFPLDLHNVFANDLVYQAMLVWVRKQLSMGSLPSSTKRWTSYQQIKPNELFYLQLKVVEQGSSKLIADISLISEDKKLLAEVKSAEVTISENLNDLFKPHSENRLEKIAGL